MGIFLLLLSALLSTTDCFARPVSYAGGFTVMSHLNSLRDTLFLHYSPTAKFSLGVEGVSDKISNTEYFYFRYTQLLLRKNYQNSQANLYLNTGISSNGFNNYFYGISGDWETRRIFTGFGYRRTPTDRYVIEEKHLQVGIAPYIGDYGDLHTWLMLRLHHDTHSDVYSLYPVIKLFKGNILVEFGYHPKAKLDIHFMYRF